MAQISNREDNILTLKHSNGSILTIRRIINRARSGVFIVLNIKLLLVGSYGFPGLCSYVFMNHLHNYGLLISS